MNVNHEKKAVPFSSYLEVLNATENSNKQDKLTFIEKTFEHLRSDNLRINSQEIEIGDKLISLIDLEPESASKFLRITKEFVSKEPLNEVEANKLLNAYSKVPETVKDVYKQDFKEIQRKILQNEIIEEKSKENRPYSIAEDILKSKLKEIQQRSKDQESLKSENKLADIGLFLASGGMMGASVGLAVVSIFVPIVPVLLIVGAVASSLLFLSFFVIKALKIMDIVSKERNVQSSKGKDLDAEMRKIHNAIIQLENLKKDEAFMGILGAKIKDPKSKLTPDEIIQLMNDKDIMVDISLN